MKLSGLLIALEKAPEVRRLIESLQEAPPAVPSAPIGLLKSGRAALVALLRERTRLPILVLTARADRARILADQIRAYISEPQAVLRLPDPDALPYERIPWSLDTIRQRLAGLHKLLEDRVAPISAAPVIVASARGLMQKTMPVDTFRRSTGELAVGQRVLLNRLIQHWVTAGYRAREAVEEPGEFSRRGGILDVYPPNQSRPVRVEFFGNQIDSLRFFDPLTQRSEERIERLVYAPASEALPALGPGVAQVVARLNLERCHPMARLGFEQDVAQLAVENAFRGVEYYLPFMYNEPGSLVDYLPEDGLLIIEEHRELAQVVAELEAQAQELYRDSLARYEAPENLPAPYFTWEDLEEALSRCLQLRFASEVSVEDEQPSEPLLATILSPAPVFGGQIKMTIEEVLKRHAERQSVVLVSRQAPRLSNLLSAHGLHIQPGEELVEPPAAGTVHLIHGMLHEGWQLHPDGGTSASLLLLSDAEIFGWRKPQPRRGPPRPRGVTPESFFADLKPGDLVVHIEHGVGVFQGLSKLDLEGVEREYLEVDYAAGDKLYVPIHQADRISRYVGPDDKKPQLNRLGTADWATVKRRAQRAVEDIAQELLQIYARREIVPGRAFGPDAPWQDELEASFPYPETDDQLRAIEEVKRDMEKARPMDRLICGDVGYGKTEVALRASFKAVMDGSQVAMLVPTTVLAQQHFETFKRRLAPYPVEVEMLSRFRSRKEQKRILKGLRQGSVDIVIGTHRLLQNDVVFKDLGLLIIDEEQRFGVKHKEKLKSMRAEVDVLTLTATPIPRTLHMSLTGVRDMSTIDTPPAERLAVKTTIAEMDESLIRTAILRELDRGGQVYFVHNRVIGIEQVAQRVRKLAPEASVAVAHGQMPERELEQVMRAFAAAEYDVLVCTSIIESGIDIPNVNTIIINRADTFGLGQLYQLRGRVGRGAVRAYAYLMVPTNMSLSEVARRRLEAIVEASELGAGFRIAMQDLELRGAGDLLGQRQHGHIAAVGFDLYCRLLAQAVRELKGGEEGLAVLSEADTRAYLAPLDEEIQINLPLTAYLPEDYVAEESLRLRLYRRMAGLTSEEEIDGIGSELEDRFGPLPAPALHLLYQLRVKLLARAAQIQAIGTEVGQVFLRSDSLERLSTDGLQRRLETWVRVGRRQVSFPLHPDPAVWQAQLEKLLRLIHRLLHDPGA